jgi:outer membrane protein
VFSDLGGKHHHKRHEKGDRVMDKKRLGVVVGILVLMGGLLMKPGWSAELKVGSVDIQKAVNECNAGKEAKKVIMKEVEKFQQQIAEKQKDLQQIKDSLEKQAPMLNPDARAAKEKDFQARTREFQRWGEDNQNELNQKRMEIERNIAIGLQKVIQKVGADEGFTLILENNEQIVLYTSKAIDITDRVIKAYDAQKK